MTTPSQESRIAELHRGLTNHTPSPEQVQRIERVRHAAKTLGTTIIENTQPSRDQSIALTALEDATMRAVRAIVLEPPIEPVPPVTAATTAYHDGAPAA